MDASAILNSIPQSALDKLPDALKNQLLKVSASESSEPPPKTFVPVPRPKIDPVLLVTVFGVIAYIVFKDKK